MNEQRLLAAVELVGRSGARQLEIGWTDDEGPRPGECYASAFYRGARVTVEHQEDPASAVEALAFRLMDGGQCVHCGQAITVPGFTYADGRPSCEFRREGEHWVRGCDGCYGPPAGGLNREQRRRQQRVKRLR